jgi:hypothetical protein
MRMTQLLIIIALFASLTALPRSVRAAGEQEPNNTQAQANPIALGYANAVVDAALSSGSDVDFFKFVAEAGRTYVIETYNIQGQPRTDATGLWVYNNAGTELQNDQYGDNGTGAANARIIFKPLTAGTYFIRVRYGSRYSASNAWTGNYSLRVLPKHDETGFGWAAAADYEPNDVLELANPITVGLAGAVTRQLFDHTAFVTDGADQDYYRFTAVAGRTYVIETYDIQGQLRTDATGLWLYNSSGTELQDDQYGDNGTGVANARIVFKAVTSGAYYVRVRHGARYSLVNPWIGTYSLRILPRHDEPGARAQANGEPNDVLELANPIQPGADQALTRTLFANSNYVSDGADHDYYVFSAQSGVTYVIETFNVQKETDNDATGLWLYNSSGVLIRDDSFGDFDTGNVDAQIVFTTITSGSYYVRVRHGNRFSAINAWTGNYSLRVCVDSCEQRVFLPLLRRR